MNDMQRSHAILIGLAVIVLGAVVGFVLLSSAGPPSDAVPSPNTPQSAEPSASANASLNAELTDRRWTVLYVGTGLNEPREEKGDAPNTDALLVVSLSADQSELMA